LSLGNAVFSGCTDLDQHARTLMHAADHPRLPTGDERMYITEAYRMLVSVKLHGREASGVSPEQLAEAKTVVEANATADPLYRKILRDLSKAGR
jgi:hypothetical protein